MAGTKDEALSRTADAQVASTGEPSSDSDDNVSLVNERALLRKLDANLLPAVGLLYLLSFLDRSNGMQSRRGADANYGLGCLTHQQSGTRRSRG